jgi:FAD/FMN-containing dehydrogenase
LQVKFANKQNVPFLAYNTAHGAMSTLGRMKGGIEILLSQLNDITVAKDGQTVTIGGGTVSHNLTTALWAAGKQTGS